LKPLLKSGLSPLAGTEKGLAKAAQFMQKLQLSENRQIRELARTPLLLHLVCVSSEIKLPAKRTDFTNKDWTFC